VTHNFNSMGVDPQMIHGVSMDGAMMIVGSLWPKKY
jgi:hypothetical protein